jgi:hypothetical protein
MKAVGRLGILALIVSSTVSVSPLAAQEGRAPDALAMSPAVACEKIEGYERYVPREEAALTKDEKLLVYYRPLNYKVERYKTQYRAHLTQDIRVRKRGEKAVLWKKDKMVDYQARLPDPSAPLCMQNTIALKALSPGEYDLDIVLHDQLAKGATAVQTLKFRVKPSPVVPPPDREKPGEAEGAERPTPGSRKPGPT